MRWNRIVLALGACSLALFGLQQAVRLSNEAILPFLNNDHDEMLFPHAFKEMNFTSSRNRNRSRTDVVANISSKAIISGTNNESQDLWSTVNASSTKQVNQSTSSGSSHVSIQTNQNVHAHHTIHLTQNTSVYSINLSLSSLVFRPTLPGADHATPFPRWGQEGIALSPLLDFIDNIAIYRNTTTIDTSTPPFDVAYFVDSDGLFVSDSTKWSLEKVFVRSRTMPTEQTMVRAWRLLQEDCQRENNSRTFEGRWPRLESLLVQNHTNPSGDTAAIGFPFVGWYGDYLTCNYHNWPRRASVRHSIPLFTVCAALSCHYGFPIPNYKTFQDSQSDPQKWASIMVDFNQTYPWESKIRKVVWRGGLTGALQSYTSPRARIGIFAATHSKDLFDMGIVSIPDRHARVKIDLARLGGLVNKMPMQDFQRYRAILDIDGNSWSSRFGKLLCYNSVIIKVEPKLVDYFHLKYLVPWKHFVPVRYDLSDLEEKAKFVMDPKNDELIGQIVVNANEWCRQHMTHSKLAEDFLDVWEQYVHFLDRGDAQWMKVWAKKRDRMKSNKLYRMNRLTKA